MLVYYSHRHYYLFISLLRFIITPFVNLYIQTEAPNFLFLHNDK